MAGLSLTFKKGECARVTLSGGEVLQVVPKKKANGSGIVIRFEGDPKIFNIRRQKAEGKAEHVS